MDAVIRLKSLTRSISPLNRLDASCWKQNAISKPIAKAIATISVDSAINFNVILH